MSRGYMSLGVNKFLCPGGKSPGGKCPGVYMSLG